MLLRKFVALEVGFVQSIDFSTQYNNCYNDGAVTTVVNVYM